MAGRGGVEVVAAPRASGTLPGHRRAQGEGRRALQNLEVCSPSIVSTAVSTGRRMQQRVERSPLFPLPLLSSSYSSEAQFSWKPCIIKSFHS